MMLKKYIIIVSFFISFSIILSASQFQNKFLSNNYSFSLKSEKTHHMNMKKISLSYTVNLLDQDLFDQSIYFLNSEYKNFYINSINQVDLYQNKTSKKRVENPIRRAEILFFGSLTFATFGGWLFMSLYNVLIYDEIFGKLRKEQFLMLYLGSSVISISVVLSDIFVRFKPKKNRVNFL